MSIQLITGFTVNNSTPLDNRIVASGAAARNSIPYKYTGLRVFDTSDNRAYYYNGVTFSNEITDQVNGVSGYVPVFTSQNYIGNSGIFQVNSGTERRIGINTTNPTGVYTYMQFGGMNVGEDPSWFSGQSLPLTIHKGGTNVIASNWYYTGVVGGNGYFNSTKGSSLIGLGNEGDVNISNRPGGPTAPVQTIYLSNNNKVGIGSNWNSSVLPAEVLDVTGNIKTSGFFKGDGSQITNIISDRSKTASSVTVYNGAIGAGNMGGGPVGRLTYLMFSSTASNVNGASVSTYYYNSRGTGFAYDTNNDQLLLPQYLSLGMGDYYSGAGNPPIAFSPTTGIYGDSSFIGFAVGASSPISLYSTYSYAVSPIRYASGSSTAPSITFNTDTNTGIYRSTSDQISFTTNGTPRMHIRGSNTGNGGVVFTTATTINSSVKAPYIQVGSAFTSFSTAAAPDYTWYGYTQSGMYMPSANVVAFSVGGTQKFRISQGAATDIIISSPLNNATLSISKYDLSVGNGYTVISSNAACAIDWTGQQNFYISSTASITGPLDVGGIVTINNKIKLFNVSGTGTGTSLYRNNTTGELQTSSSDIRLKENIIEIEQSLSKVTKLRGVYFNWREDKMKEKQIGLIAQEVEEFFPEGVQLNGVSDYKTVRYSEMVGLLINAIKEQQLMIEDLTKRVEGLES